MTKNIEVADKLVTVSIIECAGGIASLVIGDKIQSPNLQCTGAGAILAAIFTSGLSIGLRTTIQK